MTDDFERLRTLHETVSKGWIAGSGYEQSERGNYIADEDGRIVAAEQDGTDCVLEPDTRDLIVEMRNALPVLLDDYKRLETAYVEHALILNSVATHLSCVRFEELPARAKELLDERGELRREVERLRAGLASATAAISGAALDVLMAAQGRLNTSDPLWSEIECVLAVPHIAGRWMLDSLHAAEAERDALRVEVEQLKSKVAAVSHECEVARDNSQAIYSAMVDLEHVRDRLNFQLYCADRDNDKAREENARLQAEIERLKALRKGGE